MVTSHDHFRGMAGTSDRVGIAELKARLSEYVRQARAGRDIVVLDRDRPVARLVRYDQAGSITVRAPRRRYAALHEVPLPPHPASVADPVDLLREGRARSVAGKRGASADRRIELAYLDSSVVLRVLLRHPARLEEWPGLARGIGSAVLEVECLRVIDRMQLLGMLATPESLEARAGLYRLLDEIELVELTPEVLRRAGQPFGSALGALDALHLASLEVWREARRVVPVLATHDRHLADAARAIGYDTIGISETAEHRRR